MKGLARMVATEFKLYLRDTQTVLWTLAFPVVMIVLFGEVLTGKANVPGAYLEHFVPGLVALSALSVAFFSIGVQIAMYREHGIYRRLRVTPVTTGHLVLGHAVPALALVLVNLGLTLAVSASLYNCAPRGSAASLVLATIVAYLAFAALAFGLASLARTGRAANSAAVALLMPMMLLSGVLFPPDLLSPAMRTLGRFLPLTPAVELIRGLWAGTATLADPNLLVLAAWLAAGLLVTRFLFAWD